MQRASPASNRESGPGGDASMAKGLRVAKHRESSLMTENSGSRAVSMLKKRLKVSGEGDALPIVEDRMDVAHTNLLNMRPDEREMVHLEKISYILGKFAPNFCTNLTDMEQTAIASRALYHFFVPNTMLVEAKDTTAFFFIVLDGSVTIREPQIHHSGKSSTGQMHEKVVTAGKSFHDYPLVTQAAEYGFSATVNAEGASILLVSKTDYVHILGPRIAKAVKDTVSLLKSTPFFSQWSEESISRLYFWFERKKFPPEHDIVKEGDDANFCFILRSGQCNVLVATEDGLKDVPFDDAASDRSSTSTHSSSLMTSTPSAGTTSPSGSHINKASCLNSLGEPSPSVFSSAPGSPRLQLYAHVKIDEEELGGLAARLKATREKQLKNLKIAAAMAFQGKKGFRNALPVVVNQRHVVTLRPGTIVGEIALLSMGAKRMATVRTADFVEVLILDKQSFLGLDQATLSIIKDGARFRAACTRTPSERTKDDVNILHERMSQLRFLSNMSATVQLKLCKVMRYSKVCEGTMLMRKGHPANVLYLVVSGSVSTYSSEPRRRRWSLASVSATQGVKVDQLRNIASIKAYESLPRKAVLAGSAIGEDEVLQDDGAYSVTVITDESVELMGIDAEDYRKILRDATSSEQEVRQKQLVDFLISLKLFRNDSSAAARALASVVLPKRFLPNQLCLAYPPKAHLGMLSYSPNYVYIVYSGEAQLLCSTCAAEMDESAAPTEPLSGPLADFAPPIAAVQRYMGSETVRVAALGPGEHVVQSLLPYGNSRWCLKPVTALELLIIPTKDWHELVTNSAITLAQNAAKAKSAWFQQQLDQATQLQARCLLPHRRQRVATASRQELAPLVHLPPSFVEKRLKQEDAISALMPTCPSLLRSRQRRTKLVPVASTDTGLASLQHIGADKHGPANPAGMVSSISAPLLEPLMPIKIGSRRQDARLGRRVNQA